jgi:hypothetical protein
MARPQRFSWHYRSSGCTMLILIRWLSGPSMMPLGLAQRSY